MNEFISKFKDNLSGVLCGFDRLVVRGDLGLNHESGMKGYLWAKGLGLKDFASHAEQLSRRVKQAALAPIEAAGRPVRYLNSGKHSKEEIARQIAAADRIACGPICALTAVELCRSYAIRGSRLDHKLHLERAWRKCLFVYQYWIHPVFGFMSTRLQTWFPFTLHLYLNGREWLARQMDETGLCYQRHDNCFLHIEDFARAQQLMDRQLETNWPQQLDQIVPQAHPLLSEISTEYPLSYYWTCAQSEWADDYVFSDASRLRRLYPQLLQLGMTSFSSPDVLRFMGKKVTAKGFACGATLPPLTSDLKLRSEGVRIKHRLGANSIKLYDKAYSEQGAVLRAELTINAPETFRVYRPKSGGPDQELAWRSMRRGMADLHRRAEVSQKALDRYATALARVDDTTTLAELTAHLECRVRSKGVSFRALHPFDPDDYALLEAVNRGEFTINGLRNRDLERLLHASPASSKTEARRRSAAVSRKLRLLRAHGILQKLPHTHRYQVTDAGRLILNAITSARRATIHRLTSIAA
jgi:hypothetical protein